MDGRLPIILLAAVVAVSGCRDEQAALTAPPDPEPAGAPGTAGADQAGPAVAAADSATEAGECDPIRVEIKVEGGTETVYLCRRETEAAGGSASADGVAGDGGDGTQICWYKVVEVRIGGVLVSRTEELLFCEPYDPNPGGGGADPEVTLTCPGTPERGSMAACAVTVADDDAVNASELVFDWTSGFAAWSDTMGTGGSEWSGVATDDAEITVTVTGGGIAKTSRSATVAVQARTWAFDALSAAPVYTSAPGSSPKAWGGYHVGTPTFGGLGYGSGPWEGQHFIAAPPVLSGTLYLHSDFTTSGDTHGLANRTCNAVRSVTANVYDVNRLCGYGGNLATWEGMVEAHERDHENGGNKCLSSGTAAGNVLADLEKITGENNSIILTHNERFNDFIEPGGPFMKALETTTATPTSPEIWEWRDNSAWTFQALAPIRHSGTNGC